jgi:hypothetical protein
MTATNDRPVLSSERAPHIDKQKKIFVHFLDVNLTRKSIYQDLILTNRRIQSIKSMKSCFISSL